MGRLDGGLGRARHGLASARARTVNCATQTDRTVWCWGRDDGGQLGDLGSGGDATTPQRVPRVAADWVAGHDYGLTMLAGGLS